VCSVLNSARNNRTRDRNPGVWKSSGCVFAFRSPTLSGMGEMKRAEARYRAERSMEQEAERRAQGVIIIAAAVIAAVRLAREPNVAVQTPRVASVIGESVALARAIAERVRRA
jgi:hypothetical protein